MTGVEASTSEDCLTAPLDTPLGSTVLTWPVGESRRVHRVVHTCGKMPQECRVLADFQLDSLPGNERVAARRVIAAVTNLGLTQQRLERLETAVAEATSNAIEHGNQSDAQ